MLMLCPVMSEDWCPEIESCINSGISCHNSCCILIHRVHFSHQAFHLYLTCVHAHTYTCTHSYVHWVDHKNDTYQIVARIVSQRVSWILMLYIYNFICMTDKHVIPLNIIFWTVIIKNFPKKWLSISWREQDINCWDFRFSQWWIWRQLPSRIVCCVVPQIWLVTIITWWWKQ